MGILEKINSLSWTPSGEAKTIYDEFLLNPDYSNADSMEKLLICLTYEGQYSDAVSLAKSLQNRYRRAERLIPYLFHAIACDLTGERDAAICGYKKILELDVIPSNMFSQFGIMYCCREFIEYLIENPFSTESVANFSFPMYKNTFELVLQKEWPVAKSPHFNVYCQPGSTAESEIDTILSQREQAYQHIAEYLGYKQELTVDLYLFEDAEEKRKITGHTGAGWAYGTSMIEVYNSDVKVNPYHELVHVMADTVYGNTVSAFSEGLAVYLCNLFDNAAAMDVINAPYNGLVKQFYQNNELFIIKELLSFQIGSAESKPGISYRQAASFIEFLIKKLGKDTFFGLYKTINPDYT
ncbi:MAG: hypothetical protein FWC32_03915, partial [Firmicutes bacterium]|nr:hypothetical protein [Bacillota bacterium]